MLNNPLVTKLNQSDYAGFIVSCVWLLALEGDLALIDDDYKVFAVDKIYPITHRDANSTTR